MFKSCRPKPTTCVQQTRNINNHRTKRNNNNELNAVKVSKRCCCMRSGSEEVDYCTEERFQVVGENLGSESEPLFVCLMLVGAWLLLDLTRFTIAHISRLFDDTRYRRTSVHPLLFLLPALRSVAACSKRVCHSSQVPSFERISSSMSQDAVQSLKDDDDDSIAYDVLDTFICDSLLNQIAHTYSLKPNFSPGMFLRVLGVVNPKCKRFSVDFTCGRRSMVDGTIAFHFNPRLQEGYVVRNCSLKGFWDEEETTSVAPFTLKPNDQFELIFYMTQREFFVTINGRHFCCFRHRMPWRNITTVEFIGDIIVKDCVTNTSSSYPFIPQNKLRVDNVPMDTNYADDDDFKLPVPYLGRISEELGIGGQIEICGKVKLLPHSFYINLQHSLDIFPHTEIPLHLNPRFSAACGSNSFVRNAWTNGQWGSEERAPGFPFTPGYSFTLIVRIEGHGYSVWVNKQLIAECPHRGVDKHAAKAVYIQGDIHLRHVSLQTKSRNPSYRFAEEKLCSSL